MNLGPITTQASRSGLVRPERPVPSRRDVRLKAFLTNFPIPEAVVGGIAAGLVLQALAPVPVPGQPRACKRLGAALVAAGGALMTWSTVHARGVRIADPDRLLTRGPYALTRNPMYLGWLGVATGLGCVLNSAWLLATTALAFLYLHHVEIPQEEAALAARFGASYARYLAEVPRY